LNVVERGALGDQHGLQIVAQDQGPGISRLDQILAGSYRSKSGMGVGLRGAKALMHGFNVRTGPNEGTQVTLLMWLPASAEAAYSAANIEAVRAALRHPARPEGSATALLTELQAQNQELLSLLQELTAARDLQQQTNLELQQTNLGVVALNAQLQEKAEQLGRSEATLLARNADLKGFAYTVSHDLKAPLRGIVGYAQELQRRHQDALSDRARFCTTQILSAGRNLDLLIEDLLSYARLDAEPIALVDVNVPALVHAILRDRSLAVAEHQVEVSVAISFTLAHLWERGLHQVLSNLIDNALKYSRQSVPPRLSIAGEETPDGWRLSVTDNGIGFDPRHRERIFGLFSRLAQAPDFEGTGAGLAIVKKIIDKQGGKVWAESAPGQGASFFIELSARPNAGTP